jgi:small subunit ribosomal protein S17|tara:strand:- start:647 stop:976 length:330 start_codon:yes stop_codon:yes gene_type:complete
MTRNIGLPVKESKKKIEENEKNNPFNGTLSIRGKIFEGTVINAKANGTIVIQKESPIYFKKFKRFGRSKNKIHAHVPSNINVEEGDYVIAAECRPISKSVSFVVVEVRT